MIVVAVLLPWLALLMLGRVFQAAFCLGLQLTLIGWIPAAVWAMLAISNDRRERQYREMLRALRGRGSMNSSRSLQPLADETFAPPNQSDIKPDVHPAAKPATD